MNTLRSLCASAALTLLLAAPGVAQEKAAFAFTSNGAYGKIQFTLRDAMEATANVSDGVLIVRFARPVAFDPTSANGFPSFVSAIRPDPDGRTYRLALTRPYRVSVDSAGGRIEIALMPPEFGGEAKPIRPALVMAGETFPAYRPRNAGPVDPATLPALKVRAGDHGAFSRVVFDFDEQAGYRLERDGGRLSIAFDRLLRPNLTRLNDSPPDFVRSAAARYDRRVLTVDLTVDAESKVQDFRDGDNIVLDIYAPRVEGAAAVADAAPSPAATSPAPAVSPPADAAPPPRGTDAAAQTLPPPPRPVAEIPALASKPRDTATAQAADHANPPATETAHAPESAPVAAAHTSPPDAGASVAVTAEDLGRSVRVEFGFAAPAPAAIFARAGTLWVVFPGEVALQTAGLAEALGARATLLAPIPTPGATVLRFRLAAETLPSAQLAGDRWVVTFGESYLESPRNIDVVRRQADDGREAVLLALAEASPPLWLDDPHAGDRIAVAAAKGPMRGLLAPRRFVEFGALATLQGAAVAAFADDLAVEGTPEGLLVRRPGGLALTATEVAQIAPQRRPQGDPLSPAFADFAGWRAAAGPTFLDGQRRLMGELGAAPAETITEVRLSLARFYLGWGFAAETLGVLRTVEASDPKASASPRFRAMRAIANILMDRPAAAKTDLNMTGFEKDPDAALWRSLALASLGDHGEARRAFQAGQPALMRYDADWQGRFRVAAARTALALNDPTGARRELDVIPRAASDAGVRQEASLLAARAAEALGRDTEALEAYARLAESRNPKVGAEAAFRQIALQHKTGALNAKEAIDAMSPLVYRWRGDDLELSVLRELGRLQFDDGQYADGLRTWKAAVANFPESDLSRHVAQDMAAGFESLFLEGRADAMPPVAALGLYYEFKELTPVGTGGDEMIRRLADRLVAVDLLPQAAELLQHQVDKRLEGVARASVATRLATVYLLDRRPNEALAAIRGTRQTRLPEELAGERRILEARALAALQLYDQASDLIHDDETRPARQLRADIAWEAKDYPAAAQKLEQLVDDRWQDETPLDDAERLAVLRAAIAYSLADDAAGLDRLRGRFARKMAASADAQAFDIVTARIETQGVAFRELAARIAGTGTLDAFMAQMRSRVAANAAPATTN